MTFIFHIHVWTHIPWVMYGGQLVLSFLPMSREDGKGGYLIRWQVPLPTQLSYFSKYAFLNPILQLTNPQIIFVKVCIII